MQDKKRNQRIFIIGFALFISIILFWAIDMASRTTAPWNKPELQENPLPGDDPFPDSLKTDSLVLPR